MPASEGGSCGAPTAAPTRPQVEGRDGSVPAKSRLPLSLPADEAIPIAVAGVEEAPHPLLLARAGGIGAAAAGAAHLRYGGCRHHAPRSGGGRGGGGKEEEEARLPRDSQLLQSAEAGEPAGWAPTARGMTPGGLERGSGSGRLRRGAAASGIAAGSTGRERAVSAPGPAALSTESPKPAPRVSCSLWAGSLLRGRCFGRSVEANKPLSVFL